MNGEYAPFVEKVLNRAAEIALSQFGKVSSTTKPENNNQVLTETDLAVGQFVIGEISKAYPGHNIIDEEAGVIDKRSEYTWVIDPIDGTSNFASGVPNYGIFLGLLKQDVPWAGGTVQPAFNELYLAEKNQGAFCNGKKIMVTSEINLRSLLVGYLIDSHTENPEFTRKECSLLAEIILNIRNLRVSGSGAIDAMRVAKGQLGGFIDRKSTRLNSSHSAKSRMPSSA